MSLYRLSRSDLGSTSSVNESTDLMKKYKKYKDMSKELLSENEELKQVMHVQINNFLTSLLKKNNSHNNSFEYIFNN